MCYLFYVFWLQICFSIIAIFFSHVLLTCCTNDYLRVNQYVLVRKSHVYRCIFNCIKIIGKAVPIWKISRVKQFQCILSVTNRFIAHVNCFNAYCMFPYLFASFSHFFFSFFLSSHVTHINLENSVEMK